MQSPELQDHGQMIWEPEDNELFAGRSGSSDVSPKAINLRTLVWWDTESCPVPAAGLWIDWDAIASHLMQKLGLSKTPDDVVTLITYGEGKLPDPLLSAFETCGFDVHPRILPTCTLPGAECTVAMKTMIVDLLFWALNNGPPAQVRIICAAQEKNFLKLLRGLLRRSYDVFVATSFSAPSLTFSNEMNDLLESTTLTKYWQSFFDHIPSHGPNCKSSENPEHSPENSDKPVSFNTGELQEPLASQSSLPRPTYKDIASRGTTSGKRINRAAVPTGGEIGAIIRTDSSLRFTGEPCRSEAVLDEVKSWLHQFIDEDQSHLGMDISMVPKSFESCYFKKLDLEYLGFPTLTRLLENFSDVVCLKHPSKDRTIMFPLKLGAQAEARLISDFRILLDELLPDKDSEFPLSHLKTAFKSRFQYDLTHEAAGYSKLHQFVATMPRHVRIHHTSPSELVIQRPGQYFKNLKKSRGPCPTSLPMQVTFPLGTRFGTRRK